VTLSSTSARTTRTLLLLAVLITCIGAQAVSSATGSTTCLLGGPAGTASVLRLVLPRSASTIALRVTSPTSLGARSSDIFGGRSSWHLVTGLSIVRASNDQLVASRFVQSGSSPRRLALSAAGLDERVDLLAPGAPFNHVGGDAPDVLPGGVYYAVAFGSDGDRALPNPWWSAELTVGAPVDCTPLAVGAEIFDHDATDFRGGQQVSAYGAGHAANARLDMRVPRKVVVGMVDAERQLVGSVRVLYRLPRGVSRSVADRLTGFAGGPGRYSFTATYDGLFPLVLVAGVMFQATA
jgi:hypothetical protein